MIVHTPGMHVGPYKRANAIVLVAQNMMYRTVQYMAFVLPYLLVVVLPIASFQYVRVLVQYGTTNKLISTYHKLVVV